MKNWLFYILLLFPTFLSAAIVVMPKIDAKLFIHQPKTNFEAIFIQDSENLKKAVKWLFDTDKLGHDYTKSMDLSATFDRYWRFFNTKWHLVDMNQDGQPELLFSGKPTETDEKEMFSIYAQFGSVWKELFWDDGHLLAYKIHPRTKEILLYHHRYPCCSQSTHVIVRLRFLKNKMYQMKRFFLARDSGMKGNFFPTKSVFKRKYARLKEKTMLYWSSEKISEKASLFSSTNEIIQYPKDSIFKILVRNGKWTYVQMITPPINEPSPVVNAANLLDVKFFGWIQLP